MAIGFVLVFKAQLSGAKNFEKSQHDMKSSSLFVVSNAQHDRKSSSLSVVSSFVSTFVLNKTSVSIVLGSCSSKTS